MSAIVRNRRSLARLFGTYVPPELVEEMARDPARYDMRAENQVLTIMFCDMRNFTRAESADDMPRQPHLVENALARPADLVERDQVGSLSFASSVRFFSMSSANLSNSFLCSRTRGRR